MAHRPSASIALPAFVAVVALAGCAGGPAGSPSATPSGAERTLSAPPGSGSTAAPSATAEHGAVALALEPVARDLDGPLDLAVRPGDPDAIFIVEQVGRIRLLRGGQVGAEPVLDIAGIVSAGGERGLLGLAFHPDRADGRLFIYYTALDGRQVVASVQMDPADPGHALADSERILLEMDDPFGNHNGGGLAFGPDGYLYVSTGDGGGAGDPLDSGRHLDTLLAKILRLDVDGASAEGAGYGIPPDNPFVRASGARGEIWATGLRNPWRIRFDRATGDLWVGDVGQNAWEEIDRVPAGIGGLDFGWNRMEGFHCYPSGTDGCAIPDLTLPVAEYGHDQGCSVTGGTVYRGEEQPGLAGRYVFADYCSGRFWTLDAGGASTGRQEPIVALDSDHHISAIAEDTAGELYATDLASGEVLHVVVAPS